MTETYSNRQAAPLVGISDPMVGKRLKAIRSAHPGFIETTMQGKRLTDETIELLKLWSDDRTEFERRVTEAPTDETPTHTTTALTVADRCQEIAANVGTVEVMDATPYEQRASAAQTALADFVKARNARSQKLARNAATKRRTIEQIAAEHAVGDLMTYSDVYDRVLHEGMQATQAAAISGLDSMGNAAAEAS